MRVFDFTSKGFTIDTLDCNNNIMDSIEKLEYSYDKENKLLKLNDCEQATEFDQYHW